MSNIEIANDLIFKLSQMIMCGFEGTSVDDINPRELITTFNIGGVMIHDRNYESPQQIAELCYNLQQTATAISAPQSLPLFISVDQEGGRVNRLKPPFLQLPHPEEMGINLSPEIVELCGKEIGIELNACGINIDFAPLLDVNTNPQNPIIGKRAFGRDPELVAKYGTHFSRGLNNSGILSIGKHFPGHGDTELDSHNNLPVITHPFSLLSSRELVPFKTAIRNSIDGLMTAHVIYRDIDDKYPATISSKIITGLLRRELGFNGLVFTDDMYMDAIKRHFDIVDACVLAINSGVDIILLSDTDNQIDIIKGIIKHLKQDKIMIENIHRAYERITKVKKELSNKPKPKFNKIEDVLMRESRKRLIAIINKQRHVI